MNTDSYKAIKAKLTQKMGIYWMLGLKDQIFQKVNSQKWTLWLFENNNYLESSFIF